MPIVKFEGPDGPEEHTLLMGANGLPRLMLPEVREIQRVTGISMMEFSQALDRYDGDAWAMLIVCLWKRTGRKVSDDGKNFRPARIDDVEVDVGSIALELLPEEQAAAEKSEAEAGADEADPTQAGASSGAPTEAG